VAENPNRSSPPDFSTDNPSVNPNTHAVNPSAPTTGTEGWGNASDERQVLSTNPPSVSRDGQTSKNLGDNQAELSRRAEATAASMNVTHQGRDLTFRCADAGNADCRWETSGTSDEEIIEQARAHAQSVHGWNDWTEAPRNRIRNAIRERRAA